MSEETDKLNAEERDLRPASNRAARARQIIEDDMVVSAFSDIETMLMGAIKESRPDQSAEREDAYRLMRLMGKFKNAFRKHLKDGQIADHRILEIKERRKTLKERLGL